MVQSVLAYRFGLWTYCSIKEGVLADMVSSKNKCCLQRTSAKCQQVLTNNKQSGSNGNDTSRRYLEGYNTPDLNH